MTATREGEAMAEEHRGKQNEDERRWEEEQTVAFLKKELTAYFDQELGKSRAEPVRE